MLTVFNAQDEIQSQELPNIFDARAALQNQLNDESPAGCVLPMQTLYIFGVYTGFMVLLHDT